MHKVFRVVTFLVIIFLCIGCATVGIFGWNGIGTTLQAALMVGSSFIGILVFLSVLIIAIFLTAAYWLMKNY